MPHLHMRHGYPSNAFLTTTIMATMGEKGVTQTMLSPLLAARTLNITGIHISSRALHCLLYQWYYGRHIQSLSLYH